MVFGMAKASAGTRNGAQALGEDLCLLARFSAFFLCSAKIHKIRDMYKHCPS
jgi:hypothetical protein